MDRTQKTSTKLLSYLRRLVLLSEQREFTDSELDRAEELLYSDMTTEISYERQFVLTDDGKCVAEYLSANHPELQRQIHEIKDRYAGLTLQNLIFHVYTHYPDYAENSIIRDKVLRDNALADRLRLWPTAGGMPTML